MPSQMIKHHHAGEDDRSRIDHVLVRVFGRGAVRGLKHGVLVANIRAGRDSQAPDLRRASVRDIVAVEVWRGQNVIFRGADNHLLEDRIGNAVIDHDLFLPRAIAMRLADGVEHLLHFRLNFLPEANGRKLHSRLDHRGVLLHAKVGILVFVVQDPALAFGYDLVAELIASHFIAPFAKSAFSKFLDVALMHQSHRAAFVVHRVLDRHAHQAFGAEDGNRLDADSGIFADTLLRPRQHSIVQVLDQLLDVRSSLLPFDAGINIFSVLAEDDHVELLRMLYGRGYAGVIAHRPYAGIKVHDLP